MESEVRKIRLVKMFRLQKAGQLPPSFVDLGVRRVSVSITCFFQNRKGAFRSSRQISSGK